MWEKRVKAMAKVNTGVMGRALGIAQVQMGFNCTTGVSSNFPVQRSTASEVVSLEVHVG
jgi:hypothetical protein